MILVTGATGLVGSHLLAELLRSGIKVRATRRSGSDTGHLFKILELYSVTPENYAELIEWIDADLLDPVEVNNVMTGIKIVYHTAAVVSFDPRDRSEVVRNNVEITRNIVNSCLDQNIEKLCFVSSTAALGTSPGNEPVTEDSPWGDGSKGSAYSISKHQSEMEVWRGIAEGLNAVIVNPSIIFGPGDWSRSSSRLIKTVWDGLKYYTEGVTGYVDIKDVVKSMIWLAQSDISGERFIISSENLSYKEVFIMISRELGKPPPGILATPFLIGIAWRLDWLRSRLTGRKRIITRETVGASQNKKYFSSKKIADTMGIQFIPISKSIEDTVRVFLNSQG
jgi:dihydroflavonol-4-reductase